MAVGAIPGTLGALVASAAILSARRSEIRKEAAGLFCDMYLRGVEVPSEFQEPDEPGPWSDFDMVAKLVNTSNHPYYSVVVSTFVHRRQTTFAARAALVPPHSTMYAALVVLDGCDVVPWDETVQVSVTFIDSTGKAWQRDRSGRLTRLHIWWRRKKDYSVYGRPSEAARLHGLKEHEDANGVISLLDRNGRPSELVEFEPSKSVEAADALAAPMRVMDADAANLQLGIGSELDSDD